MTSNSDEVTEQEIFEDGRVFEASTCEFPPNLLEVGRAQILHDVHGVVGPDWQVCESEKEANREESSKTEAHSTTTQSHHLKAPFTPLNRN